MPPEPDLETLLARVALKDRKAFQDLYTKTSAKLFGICLRILKERPIAEDALQEVYVKIWHKADSYQSARAKPITWLARVAHNHAIDRLRQIPTGITNLDDAPPVPDTGANPEEQLLAHDGNRQLNACLDELTDDHAMAVRHAYLDGWTYNEIAAKLDRPPNTVKTWVRRALSQLKACLER